MNCCNTNTITWKTLILTCDGVCSLRMTNTNIVNFRATGKNQSRVLMARTLGINVSELLDDLMEKHGDAELKKRMSALQKEVERAKGFEPSLRKCEFSLNRWHY